MPDDPLPLPIVSTGWLAGRLGAPGLAVVDASWYLPSAGRDPRAEFAVGHVPGAVFWDLDALSDRATTLPHMLPDPATLAAAIGALGIGDDDRVVVYDGSGTNLSAPRVWWTFRAMGHDTVAVLDGGFAAWRAEARPVEQGVPARGAARFTARLRPALLRSQAEVRDAVRQESSDLLDARTAGRFAGTEPEPRPGLRSGHIPGARNLPWSEVVGPDGRLLGTAALAGKFAAAGVDLSRPVIVSCGSGVSACALGLALERVGHRDWAVYDGSWSEWGRVGGPEVE